MMDLEKLTDDLAKIQNALARADVAEARARVTHVIDQVYVWRLDQERAKYHRRMAPRVPRKPRRGNKKRRGT